MKKPIFKSVGVMLRWQQAGWSATVEYSTMQHANPECIEGEIGGRYLDPDLTAAIYRSIAAAKTIGVVFCSEPGVKPHLFVEGDGEDPNIKLPAGWRELLRIESLRLGWEPLYQQATAPAK